MPGLGWFGCGLHPYLPPVAAAAQGTSIGQEAMTEAVELAEGMSRQEILETVGPPSRKILLGLKEVWEYGTYSLLFESGALKEIR